ncbi:S24 family peptidase [Gemmobacter fulvus]|uniref:S24 family peptidase n=1 Tax=Gemmobacter fulvus TaxID=2840474 RepID=UPI0027969C36|nr:S24 family peptidase [Gemmobacter fulvus]MDQ1847697.1 S24 family peptidase [Gemmobacter fulvus]
MTRFGLIALQERVKAAVDAEGIRPFARRAGVGVGVVRSMLESRDPAYSSAEALAKALQLDFGFGSVSPLPSPPEPTPELFAQIPLHDALLAAGTGSTNGPDMVIEFLAFRRDWLRRLGVSPSNAVLARASGDSMQPCVWDGDMVLIDRSKTEVPVRAPSAKRGRSPVYALLDDGHARIKRIERPDDGQVILLSDNPEFPPEFAKIETLSIIGKVLWWGHTNRD